MTTYIVHHAVRKFIEGLAPDMKARTIKLLEMLEAYGRLLPPPESKKVNKTLFELRMQGPIRVRLLYGFIGDKAYVTNGFVKKSGKIPPRELRLAHKRFREFA